MIKSKALEVNLVNYHVDVSIDVRYHCIQEVISQYNGLTDSLNVVLGELGHPYKNWHFITKEMTVYALDYFYLFKEHPKGPLAVRTILKIFIEALESDVGDEVSFDAADSLIRYLNCVVSESGDSFSKFIPIINETLNWMKSSKSGHFSFFTKGFYSLNKLVRLFISHGKGLTLEYSVLTAVVARYLRFAYVYWLKVKDPLVWLEENVDIVEDRDTIRCFFYNVSHDYISKCTERLTKIKGYSCLDEADFEVTLYELLELPDHVAFIELYKDVPQFLLSNINGVNANKWKVLFLFHTMNIVGLSLFHEDFLMDINRTVSWLIDNESYDYIEQLVDKTFSTLEDSAEQFPDTTFSCILTMGRGVYKTDQIDLVELFIEKVISLGFQTPGVCGVGDDWQIRINDSHIKNIRTWLRLIELKPKWSKRLISSLIINLSVSGVFIKDTDLFPEDITALLNSGIAPVYNLTKQLARLFPTYFSDIGAEGSLRDISTRLDEITYRRDVLIHFLRKQSHVESSNRIIAFIESVIRFWETKSKKSLKPFVPPLIFSQIDTEGVYIDGVNKLICSLKTGGLKMPYDLLFGMDEEILAITSDVEGVDSTDIERVSLIASFYKLLHDKYNLDFRALRHHIEQLEQQDFPNLSKLTEAIEKKDIQDRISYLLDFLNELKSIVLSGKIYKTKSEIYKKRHFAVDIPSTYGSYYEFKFAALGLSFRVESLVNVLFEELNENIDLNLITKATFCKIYDCLLLFDKALKIDGIYSVKFERQLDFLSHSLEVREFTFTQYMDIFKGFTQAVKNIMNDYFHNVHGQHLKGVLSKIDMSHILPKYFPSESISVHNEIDHRIFEIFFRDRIAMSLGLQQLDIFLTRIHNTIFEQSSKLQKNDLQLLLNYDSKRAVTLLDSVNKANGIIYMGSKGVNMQKLHNLGLPTPPCFIVTTEAFRCRSLINSFSPVRNNFKYQINLHIKQLQKITGKIFGDLIDPMLLSVRSGSSVSQPGMMDTLVNVGLNTDIVEAIAQKKQNRWFAWDSYRRFLGCYGSAFGLERDDFDDIVSEFKDLFDVSHKKSFSGEQMKSLAMAYKSRIEQKGIKIPDSPFEQLHTAIHAVFDSWESQKARAYRSIMGISDDWGTAAVIQDMVFGNLSKKSGSGVFFTHNPRWSGDALNLWGDFTIGGQGEDVVSGLVKTFPISKKQQVTEVRDTNVTLESHFPKIYNTIKEWANILVYKRGWGPQEMEFTFEGPTAQELYLLQTRDMSIRERTNVLKFVPPINDEQLNKCLGVGIGVSGGAMNGRVVFTQEDINLWRIKEPGTFLILLRRDTVPDDIREIFATDGLLTVKGGVTSHASVVAHRLGKTCVVGCGNLVCNDRDKVGIFLDVVIRAGDCISIDGHDGSVFLGKRTINVG